MGTLARLGKLLRAFFTQPVTRARVLSVVKRLRDGAPSKIPDFEATKMFDRPDPLEGWQASNTSMDVKEAPLDTLPAELQEELTGAKQRREPDGTQR